MQDVKIKMFWLLELLELVWLHLSQHKFLDKVFSLTRIVLAKGHLKKLKPFWDDLKKFTLSGWSSDYEKNIGGKCRDKIKERRL